MTWSMQGMAQRRREALMFGPQAAGRRSRPSDFAMLRPVRQRNIDHTQSVRNLPHYVLLVWPEWCNC